jgi:hypothetical protein
MFERDFALCKRVIGCGLVLAAATLPPMVIAQQTAAAGANATTKSATTPASSVVLKPTEIASLMPEKVFFRGQSATVQIRNSGGIRFADGMLMLTSLVDASGYSSGIQQRYQAYLITEVPLKIGDRQLAPGAYGAGFVQGDHFVVMDIGNHEVLSTSCQHDADLRRPTPLQLVAAPDAGSYRLYAGRSFVTFQRAQ